MGGLAVIIIFGIIWLIDKQEKKNTIAYYDRKISEASITGDYETANCYINLKTSYR